MQKLDNRKYIIKKITKDYYEIIKDDEVYKVDLAKKTCTCKDFHYRPMYIKKIYYCRHLRMCAGMEGR